MAEDRVGYHRKGKRGLIINRDARTREAGLIEPLLTEIRPSATEKCVGILKGLGIWHIASQNLPATSCQDAARKRERLGHRGIPLWDELKSFLGEFRRSDNKTMPFLAHCRGDRNLDFEKVGRALDAQGPIRRLSEVEATSMGSAYGLVNPLLFSSQKIVQVFDLELMRPLGAPGTVMTNAGDLSWAVEFHPAELVLKLPGAKWADIIDQQFRDKKETFWGVREPQTIGVLTGNPMDSGLDLCHALNTHTRELLDTNSLGDVSMPRVIMVSAPLVGISMEMHLREQPLLEALLHSIDELCAMGAQIIAHPAHTTHHFAPEMTQRAAEKGARFLSMAEVTAKRLRHMGIKEIALLGTRYVTDLTQPWSIYREAFEGLTVHLPSPEGWKKIHDLGYEVQQSGPTTVCFNWMRDLLREEVPASCQHVVLAMTEFSPVVRQLKSRGRQGKILIDPIDFYGEALAREYLGLSLS